MIVECQSCTTRFQLDDSRIPPQGVRVRCSRCKEAFFLPHPSAGVADEVAVASPDGTQDLTRPAQTAPPAAAAAAEVAPEPEAEPESEPEVDEEDWEFSENIPGVSGPIDDDPESPEPAADASGASAADGIAADVSTSAPLADANEDSGAFGPSERFDLASDAEPEPAAADGDYGSQFELDTSQPDLSLDDSFRSGEGDTAANDDGDALVSRDLEADSGHGGLAANADFATERPSAAAAVNDAEADAELGDPENWDFFAGGDATAEAAAAIPDAADLDWSDPPAEGEGEAEESEEFADAPLNIAKGTEVGVGHYVTSGVGLALRAAGWAATLAVVGFALWTAPFLPSGAEATTAPQAAVGALRAEGLNASWVDTERLGTVLVIRGELRNPSPAATSPGMRVEIVLLDRDGETLGREAVSAGTPIARDELRGATQTELQARVDAGANALAWTPIGGGEFAAFEAVLMDVPYEAARFDVRGEPLGAPLVPADVAVPLEAVPLARDAEAADELGLSLDLGNAPALPGN